MINFTDHHSMYAQGNGNIAILPRTYVMYRNGLLKTCYHDEARALLASGKWFDITQYEFNEEVLTYEKQNDSPKPEASSEREEPRHEQRECIAEHGDRKKLDCKTDGSRSPNSQVKKRGRPKAAK